MTVELRFYDSPKLVTSVEPGQVVEALPGADATAIVRNVINSSPTNVFGYVRGFLARPHYLSQTPGRTLVERLVPKGKPSSREPVNVGREWSPGLGTIYCVVGKLVGFEPTEYDDEFSKYLNDASVTLSPSQAEVVRDQLIHFAGTREGKDYFFETPGGEKFPLRDIVLSLRASTQ